MSFSTPITLQHMSEEIKECAAVVPTTEMLKSHFPSIADRFPVGALNMIVFWTPPMIVENLNGIENAAELAEQLWKEIHPGQSTPCTPTALGSCSMCCCL